MSILALGLGLLLPQASASELLDASYTASLCKAWNSSTLPTRLGRSGSAWIDSAGSTGHQVMVINRRDCTGWTPVVLVIDADASGNATCTSGSTFSGGAFQWKFEPTTEQWADFSDGFGTFDMPGIMTGFVGPYPTAASNIDNFEVFFALAGKTALDMNVGWTCPGGDAGDIADEVEDIDRADMKKLAGK